MPTELPAGSLHTQKCVCMHYTWHAMFARNFNISLLSRCCSSLYVYFYSPGFISLKELMWPQPGGRRAPPVLCRCSVPSRPSASQELALPLPTSSRIYSLSLREPTFPRVGRKGKEWADSCARAEVTLQTGVSVQGFGGKTIHLTTPQSGISYLSSLAYATIAPNEEAENMF